MGVQKLLLPIQGQPVLARVVDYIHLSPVRAGIVDAARAAGDYQLAATATDALGNRAKAEDFREESRAEFVAVIERLANANINDNFFDTRHLHNILEIERLTQSRDNFLVICFLHSIH